jgi:RNA 3'-terminal phosphate cyclase
MAEEPVVLDVHGGTDVHWLQRGPNSGSVFCLRSDASGLTSLDLRQRGYYPKARA